MMTKAALFGLQYDPFDELDGSKDRRLQSYYVIPEAVEAVWQDAPTLVFALPGGGKSALRVYAEKVCRDSRGAKFPIRYIPEDYNTSPDFHFDALKGAFARAILVYLLSYPDIFNALPITVRQELVDTFRHLPYSPEHVLSMLTPGNSLETVEEIMGVNALSGVSEFGEAHRAMSGLIEDAWKKRDVGKQNIEQISKLIKDSLGARSVYILIDGLDGFAETTAPMPLLEWIRPLLERVHAWQNVGVYLKFFLPMDISETTPIKTIASFQRVRLSWDDALLAELIQRRIKVASNGAYDSLDAISAPDLCDVEIEIARQLPPGKKLPREMILRTRKLLSKAAGNADCLIHSQDLSRLNEA